MRPGTPAHQNPLLVDLGPELSLQEKNGSSAEFVGNFVQNRC
jgi:hypothetical protein